MSWPLRNPARLLRDSWRRRWIQARPCSMEGTEGQGEDGPPAETAKKPFVRRCLAVYNLPSAMTRDRLRDHFTLFGDVLSVGVAFQYKNPQDAKNGWVCFARAEDAKLARKVAHHQYMGSYRIKVGPLYDKDRFKKTIVESRFDETRPKLEVMVHKLPSDATVDQVRRIVTDSGLQIDHLWTSPGFEAGLPPRSVHMRFANADLAEKAVALNDTEILGTPVKFDYMLRRKLDDDPRGTYVVVMNLSYEDGTEKNESDLKSMLDRVKSVSASRSADTRSAQAVIKFDSEEHAAQAAQKLRGADLHGRTLEAYMTATLMSGIVKERQSWSATDTSGEALSDIRGRGPQSLAIEPRKLRNLFVTNVPAEGHIVQVHDRLQDLVTQFGPLRSCVVKESVNDDGSLARYAILKCHDQGAAQEIQRKLMDTEFLGRQLEVAFDKIETWKPFLNNVERRAKLEEARAKAS